MLLRNFMLLSVFVCSYGMTYGQSVFENRNITTSSNLVYDRKEWRFDAGAPVRATPWVDGNDIYFGTAKGEFYSLNRKKGTVNWKFKTGNAIHSSAIGKGGLIFFSDNTQTVYGLSRNGQMRWKFAMGPKIKYAWGFDYYYSSPCLDGSSLLIGGDDGYVYKLDQSNGRLIWKFKAQGIVRGTPGASGEKVYFGDSEGNFYALDGKTGKKTWDFKVIGAPFDLDTFGYDRKAMLGAPIVSQGKIIFGARDGYLYALDLNGNLSWKMDHQVSWVISTVAVKDSFVVTGTSDGRFVQAVNIQTGREIWKHRTPLATWSSPLINNDKVYEGCFDGQLFCLDLATGKRISQFATNGMILSSPVISDSLLYVGSDDGGLYALRGRRPVPTAVDKRFVYFDANQLRIYFREGADTRIRSYLQGDEFKAINTDTLASVMDSPQKTVIVFATNYFPSSIVNGGANSILRKYLDGGGRVVLLGNNSLFYDINESAKQIQGFGLRKVDTVLSLNYGAPDTRSFGGLFPGFPNKKGKEFGLPDFWVSYFGIDPSQVDIVLGENENGEVSSFVKNYKNGGKLVQLWMDTEIPECMDAIVKLAESDLD